MKKQDKYWLKPGVRAQHVVTSRRYTVLRVVRARYKHLHSNDRYSRVFGVECRDEELGRTITFHTNELKPVEAPENQK